ncbi:PA0069 family radical SAM protein [uncultured Bartonella sp.]|uniref:PA0069 family radical SAM protein n=1 Tax=uncultured Bartonella sp. TaxID=104108 RepID=UPI0026065CF1|nr:PA0069 family radical SAM protein [uncultured Bartonella sp.]
MANNVIDSAMLRLAENKVKGRGAALNPAGRFERRSDRLFYDGWDLDDDACPLDTSVQVEKACSIITHNDSPDIFFDRSINPYRGCEHGCIYCFARPSHSFMGLSAGVDFETKLFAKPDAARLLELELSKPGYKPKIIAIGTNTDPYQPVEKKWQIMRQVLEVLDKSNHPVCITTKSALVVRDGDILSSMAKRKLVRVALSLTTLDRKLARSMEPRASTPQRRLWAIKELSGMGVPVSVMMAPVIAGLNDHEIEKILFAAKNAGATDAGYAMLRLPYEVAPLFKDWLLREYPDRYRRVMQLTRDMRGGKDYDANWKSRMCGTGPFAKLVADRFRLAWQRFGFSQRHMKLATGCFKAPLEVARQLSFFFDNKN